MLNVTVDVQVDEDEQCVSKRAFPTSQVSGVVEYAQAGPREPLCPWIAPCPLLHSSSMLKLTAAWARAAKCVCSLHLGPRRYVSTSQIDPAISGFVTKLAEKQPCYATAASSIRIIQQPAEFYRCLLVGGIEQWERISDHSLILRI